MEGIQELFDWLVDGAPGAPNPVAVIERLGPDLKAAGVPLDRVAAFVRTLHPHIVGRSFVWSPGGRVEILENTYAQLQSPGFQDSPVATVFGTGEAVRGRLTDPEVVRKYAMFQQFASEGFTDYFAAPMKFTSGQVHAITFASRAPQGFTDEHIAAINHILRPLSRMAEIFALGRTAANLLNTYVGRNAGERIMAGHIQRGDTDTLRAILWFSDLRGFTALANTMDPGQLIRVLNDLFDCQVPAIEQHGGEVLKFMGDGLLAIFPCEGSSRTTSELCDLALDAAGEAFAALAGLNFRRSERGEIPIRFGLSLHIGDVAYGNIGGLGRLDFTCIGPAVNLASRLEGLTGKLNCPVVLSEDFARLTTRPTVELGTFELKGVGEPQRVYALGFGK